MIFLCKPTNRLVNGPALLGYLMYRVPVRRTRRNDSVVIGNYSSLYTMNCSITRMSKFVNDRDNVFEVDLIETKTILLGFH